MKKISVLTAGLLLGALALPAQEQVLKEADRALKGGKTPAEVVTIITPAFSDPATARDAQTYYIPGKAFYKDYDELYALKQFNKLPENGNQSMVDDLLQGYEFFMQALPLDTVTDAKGKVKTKYSKEIVGIIAGHFTDYNGAALIAWELKDFNKAYDAWEIFLSLPSNPAIGPKLSNVPADSTLAEVRFNQALAAWQADSLQLSLDSFMKAKAQGYHKKQLYDYAIAVASGLHNEEAIFALATEAEPLYGNEDPNYLGFIINHYLQTQDFDKAFTTIDQAIAANPGNAQYYVVKGILYDNQKNPAEAKAMFEKAIAIDANNSMALYNYGRALCEEAYTLSDSAPTSPAESEKFYNEKLVPLFRQATEYLERAWEIDNNNTDALQYLENAYYNLHDEEKVSDVQSRLGR